MVRKIDASTGIITTIAGNGSFGNLATDGSIATAGSLTDVSTIFVNNVGNLYLQEGATINFGPGNIFYSQTGAAIRKVEKATGIITTIAGNKISGF